MSALHALSQAAGLARTWQDANGIDHVVPDEALATILATLGYPAENEAAARASLDALAQEQREQPVFLSTDIHAPLALPPALREADSAELRLEDGTFHDLPIMAGVLPGIAQPGYHRLRIAGHELVLAVAPRRCMLPADLLADPSRRLWGAAIQIPSLHEKPAPFGDFGDLREAVRLLASRGADAVAISPVHAPISGACDRFSPYSPSSRLFLNAAFAPLADDVAESRGELIDWPHSLSQRTRALRRAFADLAPDTRAQVEAWAQEQGPALQRHALFDALALHLHEPDWRQWPIEFRAPDGRAAAQFAAEHADELAFHIYAQWLADRSLALVQDEARTGGMALGLIADLAVGIDPGGSDAWALQGTMLHGLTIGAPPDPLGPEGQNWGLTSFSPRGLRQSGFAPWISTIRASLRHAGGVRIDHAFGLARLWVVPQGASASDGAYLTYPFADLLRIVALESHRAGAVIVGEDLGTRPPGFVEPVSEKAILGMRVLWFERDAAGFSPAAAFPEQAVAMTGTHDTATVAGWWTGRDIEWNRRLARGEGWEQEERQRMADRKALWTRIAPPSAPQPEDDEPGPVVEAAVAHLGRTPSTLAIVPLEDLLALEEQPNLPGTIDEHPNWRRRLSGPLADLLAEPATARRVAALIEARASSLPA
jgi:4-alpha-glucanotransferase